MLSEWFLDKSKSKHYMCVDGLVKGAVESLKMLGAGLVVMFFKCAASSADDSENTFPTDCSK